jgi:hypothetical protein
MWWAASVLMGVAIGSLPIVGSLLGIRGAEDVWGWSAGESYALFVGIPIFFLVLGVLIGAGRAVSQRIKANAQHS